ncbi:hypothetical protein FB45DRAFT_928236 [Roridomyces roridus]|uniref:Uncharacterized protein n=1 Tax=Roridomyces roridus TaxID=1738132 RepID=A0AAD7BHJ5_9AGAR|nr:hypothetical protein FB45DRAFT_928236 [Roridomyces roridus]
MRTSCCYAFCLVVLLPVVLASVNFDTCLLEVRNGTWGTVGGTDNEGNPVSNISEATAITYELCLTACGADPEPFDWNIFSQQFSAWLLPYLAMVSQLPFGANNRLDNLVSMLLTMGSPTLAAYSLALTVLNGAWVARRFSHLNYPNTRNAVKILSSLQQSSFRVVADDALLASLIVLPENDEWWSELVLWLNYVHTWSISAVASIIWVLVAYVFTVVDSFTGVVTYSTLNANGQAVGSIFLWLLPIVIGWLQISPKCDHERVHQALARANAIAHVATPEGKPVLASNISNRRAISLEKGGGDIHYDEQPSAPIYNYARFIPWTLAVEEVYCGFREASEKSDSRQPVNLRAEWTKGDRNTRVHPENRRGSDAQVAAYVEPVADPEIRHHFPLRRRRWGPGVVSRFIVAAGFALSLTWGSVGAAILVAFFTPTKGLACRSGSYLIYGVMSTLIWMLLVASSVLAHFLRRYMHTKSTRLAGILAIILRRTAKVLAALNTAWIVLACLFQFASFFDRCWCNSSVFYLGKRAYNVIDVTSHDVAALNAPWLGGVALACGCAVLFLVFVNVLINPPLPD